MASSPGGRWATIGLLAAATFLAFVPALRGGFVYDSRLQVLTDPFLHDATNWPAVLSGRVLGMDVLDFNRPAMLASLMLDAAIWGTNPFGYHLTSVLLHVLNVVLVWLLLERLLVGRTGASAPDAGLLTPAVMNSPAIRTSSLPSLGAIATADALARFYSLLASGDQPFFREETLAAMRNTRSSGPDRVLLDTTSFSAGFMTNAHGVYGPSATAFGHPGAGGAIAFADPSLGLGFAFIPSAMHPGALPGPRTRSLIEALYRFAAPA